MATHRFRRRVAGPFIALLGRTITFRIRDGLPASP